jgi:hypothetical protein
MASQGPIEIPDSNKSVLSDLTGQTPTFQGSGEIPALEAFTRLADDAAYMAMFHGLPSALRIKIKGIDYVKVDGLDTKSSKKKAWYWGDQGIELIRVTQGALPLL